MLMVLQGKVVKPNIRAEDGGGAALEERTEVCICLSICVVKFMFVCGLNNFVCDQQELSGLDKFVGGIVRGAAGEPGVGYDAPAVSKVRGDNCCELYIYCVKG